MRIVEERMAALAIAAALGTLGAVSPALAQETMSSYGYALSAVISSSGTATAMAPVAHAGSLGNKASVKAASVPLISETLGIVSGGNMVGEFAIVASGLTTHAMSSGAGATSLETEADASIASVQATMSLIPPAGSTQPPAAPLLTLTATDIAGKVTDTRSSPLVTVQTGTATFGALSLSGSLVGAQTLAFQGAAPANTVLYSDNYMTVTLNQQTDTGVVECTPICEFVPKAVLANALQIVFFHDPIIVGARPKDDVNVGGNVTVGQTEASLQ